MVSDSQKKPGEFFTLRTEKVGLRVGKRPPELVRVITGCSPRLPARKPLLAAGTRGARLDQRFAKCL